MESKNTHSGQGVNHGFIQCNKNVPISFFVPFVIFPNNPVVSFMTSKVFLTAAECQADVLLKLSTVILRLVIDVQLFPGSLSSALPWAALGWFQPH